MRFSFSLALLAAAIPASAAFSQSFPPGVTPVAGAVVNVSSTAISLQTQQGPVTVHLVQPATVYEGQPSDMSHISANNYIGVGSVKVRMAKSRQPTSRSSRKRFAASPKEATCREHNRALPRTAA